MHERSKLDTVETSVDPHIEPADFVNYQLYRRLRCLGEWSKVERIYRHFDEKHGKNRIVRLQECRTRAWFIRDKRSGHVRVAANACRLRWCPICSQAKRYQIQKQVKAWCMSIPDVKFVTLTLAHSNQPLSEQISRLYRCFRNLRLQKWIKEKWKGGVWFFQVKPSESDGCWHPHLHIVLDGEYTDWKRLSQKWEETTGDSFITDIRPVRDIEEVAEYVARYAAQPIPLDKVSDEQLKELFESLFGSRLSGTWGTGKAIRLSSQPKEDLSHWEKLGTWSEVTSLVKLSDIANRIYSAWRTGKPLEEGISFIIREPQIESTAVLEPEQKSYQHYLFNRY